jgi:hypothetical protein
MGLREREKEAEGNVRNGCRWLESCKSSQETLSNAMHCFEEETVGRKQSFGFRFERRKREERRLMMQLCARQSSSLITLIYGIPTMCPLP